LQVLPQPTVSKDLRVLRESGFVVDGLERYLIEVQSR